MEDLRIVNIDVGNEAQGRLLLELLDHYARDPMGGARALPDAVRAQLLPALRDFPGYHGALAFCGERAVGLINCFTGFSTFAARPLLNIHDMVTHRDFRRRGVGAALLAWAEQRARSLGCCKVTLEVLSNNAAAMAAYRDAGFVPYELDPSAGHALLMQKTIRNNG